MRVARLEDRATRALVLHEHVAAVFDRLNRVGVAVPAVVRDRLITRGHVDRGDGHGAGREGCHLREPLGPSIHPDHLLGDVRDDLRRDIEDELGEHDVDRVLGGGPQVDDAVARAFGVLHAVVLVVPER
jgi:hypothetical protein